MLKNDYLMFGNSIMQKYCGMTSRINPLALFFLQNQEKEEEPQKIQHTSIINVRNYRYNTNYYTYNQVVKRYMYHYNQTLNVIRSNQLYANNPNFQMNIQSVQLNHSKTQNLEDLETLTKQTTELLLKEYTHSERIEEKITERVIKQLMDGMKTESLNIFPGKVKEKIVTEIIEKIVTNVQLGAQKEQSNVIENKTEKVIQNQFENVIKDSVKIVIEQNAGRIPKPVITDIGIKFTKELMVQFRDRHEIFYLHGKDWVNKETEMQKKSVKTHPVTEQNGEKKDVIIHILAKQMEPYVMGMVSGSSRFIIRQEIKKVCQKEEEVNRIVEQLQYWGDATTKERGAVLIEEAIQSLIQKVIVHVDAAKKGKEKYERQIVSRLVPLPVREMNLEFKKEKAELVENEEKGVQATDIDLSNDKVVQQKVVQVYKREQTAERKYYTHFIEKFLKKSMVQEQEEVDRSSLPAGIIYHKKPKETVTFVNKDIISIPLEMLPERKSAIDSIDANDKIQGKSNRELLIETITKTIINENSVNNKIMNHGSIHKDIFMKEIIDKVIKNNEIVNKEIISKEIIDDKIIHREIIKEVTKYIEKSKVEMSEYVDRRVVYKEVPKFTIDSIGKTNTQMFLYNDLEKAIYTQNRTLDLTLLVHEKGTPELYAGSNNVLHNSGKIEQRGSISGQIMAPVSLVYKIDDTKAKEQEKTQDSPNQRVVEQEIQEDIIFSKNIVNKQSVTTDIMETINKQTEIYETGQVHNDASVGQKIGQGVDVQVQQKVEKMISDSVSKHMDENMNEISKQVYRNLKRHIQKEQERRGL